MTTTETKLDIDTIIAVNQMWTVLTIPNSTQGEIDKSILRFTAEKFVKKQTARATKKNTKKELTIPMHYFEIVTLERYLRNNLNVWPVASFERSKVDTYKNQLNRII